MTYTEALIHDLRRTRAAAQIYRRRHGEGNDTCLEIEEFTERRLDSLGWKPTRPAARIQPRKAR